LLALRRRPRGTRRSAVAVAGLALLIVLKGAAPLQQVRSLPYLSRLANVLDIEEGTGKVRVLIWEGASHLVASDPLRAIIGYGPESMFVAYNRFYPPDLAHHEERTASPDRSHTRPMTPDQHRLWGWPPSGADFRRPGDALRYLGLLARRHPASLLALPGRRLALGSAVPPWPRVGASWGWASRRASSRAWRPTWHWASWAEREPRRRRPRRSSLPYCWP
jgi:hypothetical protein